jgi:hypothetical protein
LWLQAARDEAAAELGAAVQDKAAQCVRLQLQAAAVG